MALGEAKHSSTEYIMLPHGFEHPPDNAAWPVPVFGEVLKVTAGAARLHCDSPSRALTLGCYRSKLGLFKTQAPPACTIVAQPEQLRYFQGVTRHCLPFP